MAKSDFCRGIIDWTEEANREVAEETAKTVRAIFTMIVDRSPVLTGRFVANWHIGPTDVNYSVPTTMSWDAKIADINSTITADYFLKHDKAYMVNNVDYSDKIEYLGWGEVGGRGAYAPVQETLKKIGNGFAPVGQTLGVIAGGVV